MGPFKGRVGKDAEVTGLVILVPRPSADRLPREIRVDEAIDTIDGQRIPRSYRLRLTKVEKDEYEGIEADYTRY
jgi:hypothetical protein